MRVMRSAAVISGVVFFGHQIGSFIEGEVARIDDVHFGVGYIAPIRLRLSHFERRVVTPPHHQQRRLSVTKPLLPTRIVRDIGPVVIEEVGLDVGLAKPCSSRTEGASVGPASR